MHFRISHLNYLLLILVLVGGATMPAQADIIHEGGTIEGHATWYASDNDHIVTGTVSIAAAGSLTIEPGCVIRFEQGTALYIYGGFNAVGTAANDILFTRNDEQDQWAGLKFQVDSNSTLEHCIFEHATYYGSSAIQCTGVFPSLENCLFRNNGYGISGYQVDSPTLSAPNTFENNNQAAVNFNNCTNPSVSNQTMTGHDSNYGAVYMQSTGSFHFGSGNSITGNSWGLTIDAGSYPDLASAGNIPAAGNTHDDGLQVFGGTNYIDSHWFDVGADFIVTGTVSVGNSNTLNIYPGSTVRFEQGMAIYIYGNLDAEGTVAEPILFTRRHSEDQWAGLKFQSGSDGTLEYCTIERATYYDSHGISTQGSFPAIEHCTLRQNGYGIYANNTDNPSLSVNNTIADNTVTGISFHGCTNPSVSNQTITGHMGQYGAMFMQTTESFHLGSGNSVTGNSWGLTIDAGSYPDLASAGNIPAAGNTNDDGIQVFGGTTYTDSHWFDVGEDFIVTGTVSVGNPNTLQVHPNTTVRFEQGMAIYVYGNLDAEGTAAEPILFTRRHSDDQWAGLKFQSGSDGNLEYCTIERATYYDSYGIYAQDSFPAIEHCTLRQNGYGIYAYNAISPALSVNNTIANNTVTGICFYGCTNPSVANQTITGHEGFYGAMYMQSTESFHLGTGNSVTGNSWGLTIDAGSYPDLASNGNIPTAGNNNDDGLQVYGGTCYNDIHWYDLGAAFINTGSVSVGSGFTLNIAPGATVKFEQGTAIYVYGALSAQGTAGNAILFTRRDDDDQWAGLKFQDSSEGGFTHCTFEHATYYGSPAVQAQQASALELNSCQIVANGTGLQVTDSSPAFINCVVTGNDNYGLQFNGNCVPTFGSSLAEWNDIHGNGGGEADRDLVNGTEDIVANYIYWGTLAPSLIQNRIHHLPDDPALGLVQTTAWVNQAHDSIVTGPSAVDPGQNEQLLPRIYGLAQNAPNPFNPLTTINYSLPKDSPVQLTVMDLAGRRVATLVNETQAAGFKTVQWDATHLGSGVYLYRLQAGDFVQVRKMNLVK